MAVPCCIKKVILCKLFYDVLVIIPKLEYNIEYVRVVDVEGEYGILNSKRSS